jgi:hypothetical protein
VLPYAAKHDPKIIAELKELSRRLARAGETVMHPVQRGYFIEGSALSVHPF